MQIYGLDAYMATWEGFLDWSVKPVTFDLHNVNVVAGSDVAFATAIGRCSGKRRVAKRLSLSFGSPSAFAS
jgi:ketosteroid isomerase-like protein